MDVDVGRINIKKLFVGEYSVTFLTLTLFLVGTIISIVTSDKDYFDWLISGVLILFIGLSLFMTFIAFNQHYTLARLKQKYKNSANLFFKENLNGIIKEVIGAFLGIINVIETFHRKVNEKYLDLKNRKSHEIDLGETKLQELINIANKQNEKVFNYFEKIFHAITNNVCSLVEHHLETSGIGTYKIACCIKQLRPFYIKLEDPNTSTSRYETSLEELEVGAVYRDSDSFYKGRKVGEEESKYSVLGNETFTHCLRKEINDSVYERDNLDQAYDEGTFTTVMSLCLCKN